MLPGPAQPAPSPAPVDILVVDDDPGNLIAIEAALGDFGGNLVKAGSGDQALWHLLRQDFALILLDVRMPTMDGLATARLIRERERTRHVPIIFITGYDQGADKVLEAYALGAVDFLFKPIRSEVLRAKASVFVALQQRTSEVLRQAELLRDAERREHQRVLQEERRRWEAEMLRRQVDEERRAVQELGRLNNELTDAHRRKDEFLAMLSHELRNPLTPLHTSLEVLHSSQGEKAERLYGIMKRQLVHLTRLVDDLLDVSRSSSGALELQKESVDLANLIEQAVITGKKHMEDRAHHLEVRIDEPPLLVDVDVVRLGQVLGNLLHNAAKYTDPGGRITISARRDDHHIVVEVKDNGRGIPEAARLRIFEPFVQEEPRSSGLGVGLALVKRLVELHGGTVSVLSDGVGKGSVFTVRLPAGTGASVQRTPSIIPAPPSLQRRIVVIEDSEDVREALSELLDLWGHEVHAAPNGNDGFALIVNQTPDVAIIDLGLPDIDGCEVARRVRATELTPRPRLIALTGFGREADCRRALDAGFDAHMVKPPDVDALQRLLIGPEAEQH